MTKKERVISIFLCALCLCAVVFAVLRPQVAADAAFSALSLCIRRVVPALFLYMAAAKILAKCGFAAIFSRVTHGAVERFFRVSPCGAAVVLLGLLSGYPAGAVAAGEYLAAGKMEREEAERILPFATAASPAFLLGTVGGMFSDVRFGAVLLAAQTTSALILLFLSRGRGGNTALAAEEKGVRPLAAFAAAVKESGFASLAVCSFVTFFYVFSAMILHIFPLDGAFAAFVSGVLEISCGFARLSALGEDCFLGGLILGFGGFSVFMQTADALGDTGVRLGRYLARKALQALLCGALAQIFGRIFLFGTSYSSVLFFGREQAKVAAVWQSVLDFAAVCAFCAMVLALFLKILRFFSKK
ncbi:MAG: hypothetical protein IJ021_09610 [Clostridia bacterium]|nr:hypothetical protein [Clostridia bacterium]